MGPRAGGVQGRRVREALSEPSAPTVSAGSHRWLLAAVAVGVVVVDQLTKWWALNALDDGRIIDVVWTLRFNLAFNTGASFSLGGGYGRWIGVVALAVVGFLIWQSAAVSSRAGAVLLGMMLGGAIGNLIDRAFRGDEGLLSGAVVDFIDVQWWPIFNVADASLVIGAILLVVWTFRHADG